MAVSSVDKEVNAALATAGLNKPASSSTSVSTRKLDKETKVLARKFIFIPHYGYINDP